MSKKSRLSRQYGLSLVELMIATTLGLILLTGVIQVFLSSKKVFSTQQAVSRIQETGRMAIDFLSRDIRMAGYMGCSSRADSMETTNTLNDPTAFDFDFGNGIVGYAQEDLPLGALGDPAPLEDTDIVVLRSAGGSGVEVTKNNDGAQVFATSLGTEVGACSDGSDKVSGICAGDILVVTDCVKARVFQATSINVASNEANIKHSATGTPGNAISSWGGASDKADYIFGPGSEIIVATSSAYFIAEGTSGRPSLWQTVNGGTALELLEGVEDMAISYGVDTNASPDYVPNVYVKASAVADWSRVISVQVSLLVASIEDNVLPEKQKYTFDGEDITPDDLRLRQVFTSTIGIRSRLF